MKKITLSFVLMSILGFAGAQSLDDVKMLFSLNQMSNAKSAIDEFIQNPKKPKNATNAEAWYLKGQIYHYCSIEKGLSRSAIFVLKNDSYEALKKYQELDPKDKLIKEDSGYSHYLQLYSEITNIGVDYFNEKNFDSAMIAFIKCNEIKDYTLQKNIRFREIVFSPVDTVMLKNIGACALNAQKEDVAMSYFQKIADANVPGDEYIDIYRSLADYYSKKKDLNQLNTLLEKSRKIYPEKIDMWFEYELKSVTEKEDRSKLIAKLENLIQTYPTNAYLNYNYAVELYNKLWEGKSTDDFNMLTSEGQIEPVGNAIKNAIKNEVNEDAYTLNMLMCWHLGKTADVYFKATDKIKGKSPADIKTKAEFKAKYNKVVDDYLAYLNSTADLILKLPNKTAGQKANYKDVLRQLKSIYDERKDVKNSTLTQKKITEATSL